MSESGRTVLRIIIRMLELSGVMAGPGRENNWTDVSVEGEGVIDYVRRILCSTLQYDLQQGDVTYE